MLLICEAVQQHRIVIIVLGINLKPEEALLEELQVQEMTISLFSKGDDSRSSKAIMWMQDCCLNLTLKAAQMMVLLDRHS